MRYIYWPPPSGAAAPSVAGGLVTNPGNCPFNHGVRPGWLALKPSTGHGPVLPNGSAGWHNGLISPSPARPYRRTSTTAEPALEQCSGGTSRVPRHHRLHFGPSTSWDLPA
ncbi:uncharacterized protein CIMG_07171 [Coccidioides immitis RS]|uniref:Uncharacterized protein n=4 Tax=Coccidioides immitis TaxID=5501 RepID=J3K9S0_COCIM|nr:uncharacterized protein CIMG_07171 [Coccidioides immitis RS]EAS31692.3 hypothetical protein CIMG_07171 [Coccidioides immitis RS]KMP04351.1 hypothetical protein CIRG_04042 [Coccidioides immitis RMSCC 2394]KMU73486.1 hypothetical protein CISG_03621 [Coccidioides immitis RMSCC 3703]KMU91017.1 hypothetical protein CIHG_08953 [Coccidioides immitis H538.4]